MTLKEYLELEKIDLNDLYDKAGESSYWDTCNNFIQQNLNREMETFSPKQAAWIAKIVEGVQHYFPF